MNKKISNTGTLLSFASGTTSEEECKGALKHCGDKHDYIQEYHDLIRSIFKTQYVYSFGAGRMALYALLKSVGIGKNDEVIMEGYSCAVVPKAIIYAGAKPVFADIDLSDYGLDYDDVVKKTTPKTKAIIVQHTYGIPSHNIFKIKDFCKEKGIFLFEDCAHCFGGKIEGQRMGTIGDAAFFSTDHTKYISTSVGGIAITNDDNIGTKLKEVYEMAPVPSVKLEKKIAWQLGYTNRRQEKHRFYNITFYKTARIIDKVYDLSLYKRNKVFYMNDYQNVGKPLYDYPQRLSNVQAWIGISQIKRLKKIVYRKTEVTKRYKEKLREAGCTLFVPDYDNMLRLPLMVDCAGMVIDRLSPIVRCENWFADILECSSRLNLWKFGYQFGMCPKAEYAADHIINLPIHMKITNEEVDKIVELLMDGEGLYPKTSK